ncbi:unnamed protein product [Bemisia tabaci]|uniref:Major facilitator superfamily (MFS) profile domain-containing protein n=1 Tax=Bemisia tabaci TaxID=7038 RepID=A0A9P0AK32_BEMTA|nr:unnamed protein product [Bemisia tabaci]
MFVKLQRGVVNQIAAAFTAELAGYNFGVWRVWPSLSITELRAGSAGFAVSDDQLAWITSLLYLGFLLTPFFCSYLVVRLGRRTILYLTSALHTVSWLLVVLAQNPYHLYIANFFGGLAGGIGMTMVPVYVSEISSVNIRGALIGSFLVFINLGQVMMVNMGIWLSYQEVNLFGLGGASVAFVLQFVVLTESPFYLLASKREEKATEAYKRFHASSGEDKIETEVSALKAAVEKDMEHKSSYMELLACKRAFIILVVESFFQNLGGANSMLAFGVISLPKTELFLTPHQTILICVISGTFFNCISSSIVDSVGRKPLLVISVGMCSVFTGGLCVYFFLVEELQVDSLEYEYIPHLLLIGFIASYTSGFAISRSLIIGEFFPTNTRTHAGLTSTFCFATAGFVVTLSFLHVVRLIGLYFMFFLFFLVNFTNFWFSLFFFVETKGKNLFEIQEYLKSL